MDIKLDKNKLFGFRQYSNAFFQNWSWCWRIYTEWLQRRDLRRRVLRRRVLRRLDLRTL